MKQQNENKRRRDERGRFVKAAKGEVPQVKSDESEVWTFNRIVEGERETLRQKKERRKNLILFAAGYATGWLILALLLWMLLEAIVG